MNTVYAALLPLVTLAEESVDPKDVKAGWLGFGVFLLLAAAVVFLGFSLVKQLRKAQSAKDAGAFGDKPKSEEPSDPSEER
jgi:hypothetical protein